MPRRVALAFAATITFAVHAAAGPLAPSKPSQLVDAFGNTQQAAPCGEVPGMYRVDIFVATHLQIAVLDVTPSTMASVLFAAVDPADPPVPGDLGANSSVAGLADSTGRLQASETIPDGLVVKPPALLCFTGVGSAAGVTAHGYFTKDK